MSILRVGGIKDGKIGYLSSSSIVYRDIPYLNRFTQTQNPVELTFEGDNDSSKLFSSSDLGGSFQFDKFDEVLLEKIYNKHGYTGGGVGNIAVGAGGTGYPANTTVTLGAPPAGGIQATAHAVIAAGVITSIVVDIPGDGYTSAPTVTITGSGGSGATATATLAPLPTGVAKRLYMGEDAEFTPVDIELVITYFGVDDNGVAQDVVEVIPRVTVAPYKPGDLANKAKQTQEITWTAKKGTTDLTGAALPAAPKDGCTYFYDLAA